MRHLLIAALALAATPAAAQPAPLARVEAHLGATRTLSARFTQTAQNGVAQSGRLTLARPGRLRFQYDKAPLLIVADGRALTLIDYKVAQVSRWPIGGTPLAILLEARPDLARIARVAGESATGFEIEAKDDRHPEHGVTTLRFVPDPAAPARIRLAGWRVRDAQGRVTRVDLTETVWNRPVSSRISDFRDPRPRRVPGKG